MAAATSGGCAAVALWLHGRATHGIVGSAVRPPAGRRRQQPPSAPLLCFSSSLASFVENPITVARPGVIQMPAIHAGADALTYACW